jgi:hypothetical protein
MKIKKIISGSILVFILLCCKNNKDNKLEILINSTGKEFRTKNNKKIFEVEIDNKLIKILSREIEFYKNEIDCDDFDTSFVVIIEKDSAIEYLRFYQINNIIKEFEYIGYFRIKNYWFLVRKIKNQDNFSKLIKEVTIRYKLFPSTKYEKKNAKTIYDPYSFCYILKNDSLTRE